MIDLQAEHFNSPTAPGKDGIGQTETNHKLDSEQTCPSAQGLTGIFIVKLATSPAPLASLLSHL